MFTFAENINKHVQDQSLQKIVHLQMDVLFLHNDVCNCKLKVGAIDEKL